MQARQLAAFICGFLLVGCQSLPSVPDFEPDRYCDAQIMKKAETFPADGKVNHPENTKPVMDALRKCGKYTHGYAKDVHVIASELREKSSIWEPTKNAATVILAVEILAIGIAIAVHPGFALLLL